MYTKKPPVFFPNELLYKIFQYLNSHELIELIRNPASKRFHDVCLQNRTNRPWVPVETFKLPLCVRKAGCSCKYAFDLKGKRIFLLCILDKNLVCFVYYIKTRRIKRFELDCNNNVKFLSMLPKGIHQVFYCNGKLSALITLSIYLYGKGGDKKSYVISWKIKKSSCKIREQREFRMKQTNIHLNRKFLFCTRSKDNHLYINRLYKNSATEWKFKCDDSLIPKVASIKNIFYSTEEKMLVIMVENCIYFYKIGIIKKKFVEIERVAQYRMSPQTIDEFSSCFLTLEKKSKSLMLTRIKPMCRNGENFTVEIYGKLFTPTRQCVEMKQHIPQNIRHHLGLPNFMLK